MAASGLLDLAGFISSNDDLIATFRRTVRVYVIVNVAIYIEPASNARFLDSYCSSSRSETGK